MSRSVHYKRIPDHSKRPEEPEEDDTTSDTDEDDSPSVARMAFLCCFHYARYTMECERNTQLLNKEDLTRQYNVLREDIHIKHHEYAIKQADYDRDLAALRETVNVRVKETKGPLFTRSDVEDTLLPSEHDQLRALMTLEIELEHIKANLQVLHVALNNINTLRTDAICALHDMDLAETLQRTNQATKSSRGVDMRKYSEKLCDQLLQVSDHLNMETNIQGRLLDNKVMKNEMIQPHYKKDFKSAVDLLFAQACEATQTESIQVQNKPTSNHAQNSTNRKVRIMG